MRKIFMLFAVLTAMNVFAQEVPANRFSEEHGPWGMYYRVGVTQRLHKMEAQFGVSFDTEIGAVYYITPNWFATLGVGYTGHMNSNYSGSYEDKGIYTSVEQKMGSVKIPARIGYDFGPVAVTAGLYLDWVIEDDEQGLVRVPGLSDFTYEGRMRDNKDFNTVIPGICVGATLFKAVTLEFGLGIINRDYHTNESYLHTSLGAKVFF